MGTEIATALSIADLLPFSPGHLQTVMPAFFRQVNGVEYKRERIETPDNDFLDIDWIKKGASRVVIISHGLEGNTSRPYMKGMSKCFSESGFDVLTWNYRGCSEEINRKPRFYHSGATDDLETIVNHAIDLSYSSISLIGFSLGGNLTLKYLGEKGNKSAIERAVAISVPMHLHHSSLEMLKLKNRLYVWRFLGTLKEKVTQKALVMPDRISTAHFKAIKNLFDFDDYYTAPLHGFDNALDYYNKCSSYFFLEDIAQPTLILNARNDTFLSEESFPDSGKFRNQNLNFEFPDQGGHCEFPIKINGLYWSEIRALEFLKRDLND